jgi:dTDP-4-dehydrorhamnose 3,5-epimerase
MLEVKAVAFGCVKLLAPRVFPDSRGFFQQWYRSDLYRDVGIECAFVQDNWSRSSKGVVRGLHYQLKNPQAKLVGVVHGCIHDVVVDIRRDSPTFGQSKAFELTAENHCQLFVPEGFAHGFSVLSDTGDVFYKCSDIYTPGDEYGVYWNDPDVAAEWLTAEPIVSEKDELLPRLADIPEANLPI